MLSLLFASAFAAGIWDEPPAPVVAAPAPAPVAAPAPPPTPEASGVVTSPSGVPTLHLSATTREFLEVESVLASQPKHYYAVALSSVIGFGTGHYYAGDVDRAKLFMAWQGAGVGLMLVGAIIGEASGGDWGAGTTALGAITFVTGRAGDITLAADSAHQASASILHEAAVR